MEYENAAYRAWGCRWKQTTLHQGSTALTISRRHQRPQSQGLEFDVFITDITLHQQCEICINSWKFNPAWGNLFIEPVMQSIHLEEVLCFSTKRHLSISTKVRDWVFSVWKLISETLLFVKYGIGHGNHISMDLFPLWKLRLSHHQVSNITWLNELHVGVKSFSCEENNACYNFCWCMWNVANLSTQTDEDIKAILAAFAWYVKTRFVFSLVVVRKNFLIGVKIT